MSKYLNSQKGGKIKFINSYLGDENHDGTNPRVFYSQLQPSYVANMAEPNATRIAPNIATKMTGDSLFTSHQIALFNKIIHFFAQIEFDTKKINVDDATYLGSGKQGIALDYKNFVVKIYKNNHIGKIGQSPQLNIVQNQFDILKQFYGNGANIENNIVLVKNFGYYYANVSDDTASYKLVTNAIKPTNISTLHDDIISYIKSVSDLDRETYQHDILIIVMEKHTGDLGQLSLNDNPKFKSNFVNIYTFVLDSLLFCKTKGIVNNDLKLDNFFYNENSDGTLKIVMGDYGSILTFDIGNLISALFEFYNYFFPQNDISVDSGKLANYEQPGGMKLHHLKKLLKNIHVADTQITIILDKLNKLYDVTPAITFGEQYMIEIIDYLSKHGKLFTKDYILQTFGNQKYEINVSNLDSDIEPCNLKYITLIKKIFGQITYVDIDNFFEFYNKNLDDIASRSRVPNTHVIFITTHDTVVKSNFWLTMYSIQYLLNKKIALKFAYNIISNFIDVDRTGDDCNKQKKSPEYTIVKTMCGIDSSFLLILCDDISYSGNQLSGHLSGLCFGSPVQNILVRMPTDVQIYLNIYGLTQIALERITIVGIPPNQLIIPTNTNAKPIKTMRDVLSDLHGNDWSSHICKNDVFNLYIDSSGVIMVKSLFYSNFPFKAITELTISYLFFKYPDAQSTISSLCHLRIPFGYTIDVDKLTDADSFCEDVQYNMEHPFTLRSVDSLKLNDTNIADIKNILTGNADPTIIAKYNWIIKCNNADDNKNALLIDKQRSYQSALIPPENFVTKHNGSCEKMWKEHPKSFYKEIDYDVGKNTNGFYEYLDNTNMIGGNIFYTKYCKYKEKNKILLDYISKKIDN